MRQVKTNLKFSVGGPVDNLAVIQVNIKDWLNGMAVSTLNGSSSDVAKVTVAQPVINSETLTLPNEDGYDEEVEPGNAVLIPVTIKKDGTTGEVGIILTVTADEPNHVETVEFVVELL